MNFQDIPEDAQKNIILHCSPRTISNFCQASRGMNEMLKEVCEKSFFFDLKDLHSGIKSYEEIRAVWIKRQSPWKLMKNVDELRLLCGIKFAECILNNNYKDWMRPDKVMEVAFSLFNCPMATLLCAGDYLLDITSNVECLENFGHTLPYIIFAQSIILASHYMLEKHCQNISESPAFQDLSRQVQGDANTNYVQLKRNKRELGNSSLHLLEG
jgi:hypothetical protein